MDERIKVPYRKPEPRCLKFAQCENSLELRNIRPACLNNISSSWNVRSVILMGFSQGRLKWILVSFKPFPQDLEGL